VPCLDHPSGHKTNIKPKICHWAQNEASAMTIPDEWAELKRRSTNMDVGIWRIWRDSDSLISRQVFSKLIRHYRRRLRAVILAKGGYEKYLINYAQCVLEKSFYFVMLFTLTFNSLVNFFEWNIKSINYTDFFFFTAILDHIYCCLCLPYKILLKHSAPPKGGTFSGQFVVRLWRKRWPCKRFSS